MRGEAAAIASTLLTPCGVSRIAWTRIGFFSPCRASSSARYWSTKWMSQSPSTLGIITTSSLSPISPTSRVMSSRNQGEFSALTRAQRPVEPKSVAFAMAMKPSRAAALDSIGIASSRLPSTTSTWPASSPAFARTFSICGGTKWIIRSSFEGNSQIADAARRSRAARRFCERTSCLLPHASNATKPYAMFASGFNWTTE